MGYLEPRPDLLELRLQFAAPILQARHLDLCLRVPLSEQLPLVAQ